MLCKNCKSEIKDTAKFCPFCGTLTAAQQNEKPVAQDPVAQEPVVQAAVVQTPVAQNNVGVKSAAKTEKSLNEIGFDDIIDVHSEPRKTSGMSVQEIMERSQAVAASRLEAAKKEEAVKKLLESSTNPLDELIEPKKITHTEHKAPLAEVNEAPNPIKNDETLEIAMKKPSRFPKALKIAVAALVITAASGFAVFYAVPEFVMPAVNYSNAAKAFESGNYSEAAESFALLGDYKDSAMRSEEARYSLAASYMENGEYLSASIGFDSVSGYSDADALSLKCRMLAADDMNAKGEYAEAANLFLALGDYEDAGAKYADALYAQCNAMACTGDLDGAIAIKDASVLSDDEKLNLELEIRFSAAETLAESGEYEKTVEILTPVSQQIFSNKPVYVTINEYIYLDCVQKIENKTADDTTARKLHALGSYRNSASLYTELCYELGNAHLSDGDAVSAAAMFRNAEKYKDSPAKLNAGLYAYADGCLSTGKYAEARSVFAFLGSYANSPEKRATAEKKLTADKSNDWCSAAYTSTDGFCTSEFILGETLAVSGTAGNVSSNNAVTAFIITVTAPDGSEQSTSCGGIRKRTDYSADFELNQEGEYSVKVTLSGTDTLLWSSQIIVSQK